MILEVKLISTKEKELEKVASVMQELYSYNTIFSATVIKNYDSIFEFENLNVETINVQEKREIVNDIINNANSNLLILDLHYELDVLKDVIKTTFENNCDYIYFYGKNGKFEKFISKVDTMFFNFYLNLKKKNRFLENLNTLTYISYRIIKVMRTCDEEYSYLQNTDTFKDYDVVSREVDIPKKSIFKNMLFPLICLFNIGLVVVLFINMVKYFKTTNTILNMIIICLFILLLLFIYSFLLYYHIKFKRILKRGNDE